RRWGRGREMRARGRGVRLLLPLAALVLALALGPATAQPAAIELIGNPSEQNNFPDNLTFMLEAQSAAPITQVRFRYTFVPENRSSSANADFDPGNRVKATFTLRSATSRQYIPPGKKIRYSWDLQDAAGNTLSVPQRDTSFADPRFTWKSA